MPINPSKFSQPLETARNELLDMGLRNPLLNFRTMRARGIEILDTPAADLLADLVAHEKKLTFAPADEQGDLQTGDLQTPYPADILQKRLIYSQSLAQSHIEEKGVNVLFLALGMLIWRPKDRPTPVRAPLLLVPVTLARETIKDRFTIQHTGTDVASNLTLATKLAQDFGITLPPFDAETDSVSGWFSEVENAIPADWQLRKNELELGFFAYSRFILYKDLDPANWQTAEHKVMSALYGEHRFREPMSAVRDGDRVDKHINLAESHLVLEADSTQLMSLIDARKGRNLVIQGPPGTGKSQTITNLIGQALGQGKKVLFVAEKMAALDVVKRKLAGLGLDDLALELHSHKTTKRDFAAALHRSLTLGEPTHDGTLPELGELKTVQATLNDHSFLMNRPMTAGGPTPFEAYGQLITLGENLAGADWSPLEPEFEQMRRSVGRRSAAEIEAGKTILTQVESWLGRCGRPHAHPFYGMGITDVGPATVEQIRSQAADWDRATGDFLADLDRLCAMLNVDRPENLIGAERLITFGEKVQNAPYLIGFNTTHPAWKSDGNEIRQLLSAGQKLARLQASYKDVVIPEAWSADDLLTVRGQLMVSGSGIMRHLSSDFREAKRAVAGLCRDRVPSDKKGLLDFVDGILEAQRLRPIVEAGMPLLRSVIREERLASIDTPDWSDLLTAALWLLVQVESVEKSELPAGLLEWMGDGISYDQRVAVHLPVEQTRQAFEQLGRASEAFCKTVRLPQARLATTNLNDYAQKTNALVSRPERVLEMVEFNDLWREVGRQGLKAVSPFIDRWDHAPTHLADLFEFSWISASIDQVVKTNPHLENFDGATHDDAVERFRSLDKKWLAFNRVRLAHAHRASYHSKNAGGISDILISESKKRANNRPIRELISLAGERIQQMRPLFMMSPLSIATFLPPGEIEFDLVIFDEASQVRPVDALGAILRGKQTVVVGDNKQLPPTSFFDVTEKNDEPEETFNENPWGLNGEPESILDLFLARGAPQRMLRWHYRSQHESLIAISNREFYDQNLVLFPSPDGERAYSGLQLRHSPDTVYDRGNSRTNPLEAAEVAQAVLAHARNHPGLSLGVATFSSAQQQAIALELERVRAENADCEPFFKAHEHEPFFVKNLENVQGDERDVIFISVGYGRDQDRQVRLNFGPLNGRGGERRLNVLITRSRLRCVVFTNLTSGDIDLKRTRSVGIRTLKAYLAFAETGTLPAEPEPSGNRERPFFESVKRVLEDGGYRVEPRIGRGGVEVDLAVRTPDGRNIAIELDGRDYHRALSARDRDRIQQEVLTRLGWQVHRVWIHDWFRDQDDAKRRLMQAIAPARSEVEPTPFAPYPLERGTDRKIDNFVFPPYFPADWVEVPRIQDRSKHKKETGDRPLEMMYGRLQQRGVVYYADLLQETWTYTGYHLWDLRQFFCDEYNIIEKDRFWYLKDGYIGHGGPHLPAYRVSPRSRDKRYRSKFAVSEAINHSFERIPPAEWREGILQVVQAAISIDVFETPFRVVRAFGFGRLGKAKLGQVFDMILEMLADRRLVLKDDWLSVPPAAGGPTYYLFDQWESARQQADLRKRFAARRKKRPTKAIKTIELPIQAKPYELAQVSGTFLPIDGWSEGNHKRRSMLGSSVRYQFDLKTEQFILTDKQKIDFWGYEDFYEELVAFTVLQLHSKLAYDHQVGRFFHDGTFALTAKPSNSQKQVVFRAWRNSADGLFYGRVRSHATRNYHLFNRWAQGRSFGSARLDLCLGNLGQSAFTPKPCKKLKASKDLVEVKVDGRLEKSVRQQEFDKVVPIFIAEQPIHLDEYQRRVAAGMGRAVATTSVKNHANQVLEWGESIGRIQREGEFISLTGDAGPVESRDRSKSPSISRKLDYVHDGEITAAIDRLRQASVVLSAQNAALIVSQFLGVRKAAGVQRKRILEMIGER